MVNPREMITSKADAQIQAHRTAKRFKHHSPVQTIRGLAEIYFRANLVPQTESRDFTTTMSGSPFSQHCEWEGN